MLRYAQFALAGALATCVAATSFAETPKGLDKTGRPDIQAAGPLAFGPEGVLFVGDAKGAAVFAIGVPAAKSDGTETFKIDGVDAKIAAELNTKPSEITINDLAVQPNSGTAYLSVTVGKGADAKPALVTVGSNGEVKPVALEKIAYAKIAITKVPDAEAKDRRGRSLRDQAITDLAYTDERVYMTGLSTEEDASTVRVLDFPFKSEDTSTGIEIYHGAHGKYETGAPVRTFTPLVFGGEPHLLAAYTCTPLVKLPLKEIKEGNKVKGTTVAELGNMNQPLDIIAYEKDGKTFLLLANSARGVMKISTDNLATQPAITERISGTAGLSYDTIADLKGVEQLDKLGEGQALLVVKSGGGFNLVSVPLP